MRGGGGGANRSFQTRNGYNNGMDYQDTPDSHHSHNDSLSRINEEVMQHTMDDAAIAKEFTELSTQERERVMHDIHGVAENLIANTETPDFIEARISKLDEALASYSKKNASLSRKAYDQAKFFKPALQADNKFKLMFLRADMYDATKAARRIMKYFDNKLKLFGLDKLAKTITLEDLNEEDKKVFQNGMIVNLPQKDSIGRPLLFDDFSKSDFTHHISTLRYGWYQVMELLKDDDGAQLKGVTMIVYVDSNIQPPSAPISEIITKFQESADIWLNLPMRLTSVHICYTTPRLEFIPSLLRTGFGKDFRLRLKAHLGSDIEVQYALMTYGIRYPFFDSKERMEYHQRYIQRKLQLEHAFTHNLQEEETKTGIIQYPNMNDVLIGRGHPYQNFHGNGLLTEIANSEYYQERIRQVGDDRFAKSCVYLDVMNTLYSKYGSRFLERIEGEKGWKLANKDMARRKVCNAFRIRP